MTRLMEAAIAKAAELPAEEQDAIAAIILREIDADERWDQLFADPRSADLLAQMADQAFADVQSGRVRKLDLDEL